MKRFFSILLAVMLVFSLVACGNSNSGGGGNTPAPSTPSPSTPAAPSGGGDDVVWEMAVCLSQFSDTFLTNCRRNIEAFVPTMGGLNVTVYDGKNDNTEMTNIHDMLIIQGVDVVATNDPAFEPEVVIEKFMAAGIPLILWNGNEPPIELMQKYKGQVFFVGSAAHESGMVMGEAALKYWNDHPESDRNGDGIMDYVYLQGAIGHIHNTLRMGHSVGDGSDEYGRPGVLKAAGIQLNEVANQTANYNRAEAQDVMTAIIAASGDQIEYVFASNDDMALGAIEALKGAGYLVDGGIYIPVLGVDATVVGQEAIADGTLLATSLNDPIAMGGAVVAICKLLRDGLEVNTANLNAVADWMPPLGLEVDENGFVWTHYKEINASNIPAELGPIV